MNKSKRRFFSVLAIAIVALFALACAVGFAACGDDDNTKSDVTVSSVSLDKSTLSLTVGGDAGSLNASVVMSDSSSYSGTYTWSSDNENAAKVTGNGSAASVTAVAAGKATITVAVDNNKTATCEVTVAAAPITDEPVVTNRFEAEKSVIDVDESMMYYWLNNDVFQGDYITDFGFLFDIQVNETASNGQSVGCLAHNNPTLTFTINSDVDVTGAKITLHAASCDIDDTGISSVFGLMGAKIKGYAGSAHNIMTFKSAGSSTFSDVTLDGTLVGADSVFGGSSGLAYDTWGDLTGTIDLKAGENTIVITHDGAGVNFDYIEISTGETEATLSWVETDNSNLVVYDEKWTAYDDIELGAENAELTDAASSSTTMQVTTQSGQQVVSGITKGDKLTFKISASGAITGATVWMYTVGSNSLSTSDFAVTVNSTTAEVKDQSGDIYVETDFTQGENTIVLESASDSELVLDCLFIEWNYAKDTDKKGNYIVTTIEEIVTSSST